jgi:general secretion pathway protein L
MMQDALTAVWAELVDAATDVVQTLLSRVRQLPVVTLTSDEQHVVRVESGEPLENAAVELTGAACRLVLPSRWFFRAELNPVPLESLPFLDAFARQQIDRVTPWNPSDVYSAVTHAALPDESDRLLPVLNVVPKSLIAAEIAMLTARCCTNIAICSSDKGEKCEIAISGSDPRASLRRSVSIGLAAVLICLPCIAGLCWWQAAAAQAQADDLDARLTKTRAEFILAKANSADAGSAAPQAGSMRPPVVLLLEDLSTALPDTAYLTQLGIDGDRATIAGVALDPPELVGVLEKTGHFSDVSFADDTTKIETGVGSRFSLEMHISDKKAPAE